MIIRSWSLLNIREQPYPSITKIYELYTICPPNLYDVYALDARQIDTCQLRGEECDGASQMDQPLLKAMVVSY